MADFVCFIDRIFHFGFDELHDALFTVIGNSCQVGADAYGVKAAVLVVCNEVPAGHGVQDRGHGCLGGTDLLGYIRKAKSGWGGSQQFQYV